MEVWTNISKAAQKRERQECAVEKPKLENTRRTRGLYIIHREDEEYEETIKNGSADGSGHTVQEEKHKPFALAGTYSRA